MKSHIIAQMECVTQTILTNVPRLGHHRDQIHLVIEGHEAIEHLVASPDVRQVFGIDWIKGQDAGGFIVFEDG
jgi:hypothetical protein